jgi:hypothetical protein
MDNYKDRQYLQRSKPRTRHKIEGHTVIHEFHCITFYFVILSDEFPVLISIEIRQSDKYMNFGLMIMMIFTIW